MDIFVSHSIDEKHLAKEISNWIEKEAHDIRCFCSSRPNDLKPGDPWFDEIRRKAQEADVILLMISRDSIIKNWLYYEAGIVQGSSPIGHRKQKFVVPVLYSEAEPRDLPPMISANQALFLDNAGSFEAFCSKHLGLTKKGVHNNFTSHLTQVAKRIMQFGPIAGFEPDARLIETGERDFTDTTPIHIDRLNNDGEIAAVRLFFTPRHLNDVRHWKFGIALIHEDRQDFCFHASCERTISTWSLYHSDDRQDGRPYNLPASLDWDKQCILSVWLRDNGNEISIRAVDSDRQIIRIPGKAGDGFWRLIKKDWKKIQITAWNDDKPHNYQIDARWEVDRIAKSID